MKNNSKEMNYIIEEESKKVKSIINRELEKYLLHLIDEKGIDESTIMEIISWTLGSLMGSHCAQLIELYGEDIHQDHAFVINKLIDHVMEEDKKVYAQASQIMDMIDAKIEQEKEEDGTSSFDKRITHKGTNTIQ